jgi:hypothetical protein
MESLLEACHPYLYKKEEKEVEGKNDIPNNSMLNTVIKI